VSDKNYCKLGRKCLSFTLFIDEILKLFAYTWDAILLLPVASLMLRNSLIFTLSYFDYCWHSWYNWFIYSKWTVGRSFFL